MITKNIGGLIGWFTSNPVAANLAMILIFCAGALSLTNISKEMFPRTETQNDQHHSPLPRRGAS